MNTSVDLARFWSAADRLVAEHQIVIDRPGGSIHPRYRDVVYPFDYGYLEGTGAIDGGGVDCWRGSLDTAGVTGAVVTVDILKGDSEVKWLIGCTNGEMALAVATHRTTWQAALLVERRPHRSNKATLIVTSAWPRSNLPLP